MDEPGIAQDWGRSGIEPPVQELMNDPIMHLLLRRDGLTSEAVYGRYEKPAEAGGSLVIGGKGSDEPVSFVGARTWNVVTWIARSTARTG